MGFSKIGGHVPITQAGAKAEPQGEAPGVPGAGDLTGRRLKLGVFPVEVAPLSSLHPGTTQQPTPSLVHGETSSSTDLPVSRDSQNEDGPDHYNRVVPDTPLPAVIDDKRPPATREELAQRRDALLESIANLQRDATLPPRKQAALLGVTYRQLHDAQDALARAEGTTPPARGARSGWAQGLERLESSGGKHLIGLMLGRAPPSEGKALKHPQPTPAPPPTSVSFIGANHPMSRALQAYQQCMDDITCSQLHESGHLAIGHLDSALEGVAQLLDGEDTVLAAGQRLNLEGLRSLLQSELQTLDRVIMTSDPDSPAWSLRQALDFVRAGNSERQLVAAMELARTAEIFEASYQLGRPEF